MRLFQSLSTSGSGMTAQRLRMDVIANNLANVNATRTGRLDAEGNQIPYRRQVTVFSEREAPRDAFDSILRGVMRENSSYKGNGVRVLGIREDQSPFKEVYDPNHPDAIKTGPKAGYVRLPNVNTVQEMVDMISASRSYEANVTAVNSAKKMAMKALEIGRG